MPIEIRDDASGARNAIQQASEKAMPILKHESQNETKNAIPQTPIKDMPILISTNKGYRGSWYRSRETDRNSPQRNAN